MKEGTHKNTPLHQSHLHSHWLHHRGQKGEHRVHCGNEQSANHCTQGSWSSLESSWIPCSSSHHSNPYSRCRDRKAKTEGYTARSGRGSGSEGCSLGNEWCCEPHSSPHLHPEGSHSHHHNAIDWIYRPRCDRQIDQGYRRKAEWWLQLENIVKIKHWAGVSSGWRGFSTHSSWFHHCYHDSHCPRHNAS